MLNDATAFLHGAKIAFDNRIKAQENRIENLIFSRGVKKVKRVSAEVYFIYKARVTQEVQMVIPIAATDTEIMASGK